MFIDHKEFAKNRYKENIEKGLYECAGLRQTGRTTKMIMDALQASAEGDRVAIVAISRMVPHIARMIDKLAAKRYTADVVGRIDVLTKPEDVFRKTYDVVLVDNVFSDIALSTGARKSL